MGRRIGAPFVLADTQRIYDATYGHATEYTYEGLESNLTAIANQAISQGGVRYRHTLPGKNNRLAVTVPLLEGGSGAEPPTTVFDFQANRVQKDLLDSTLAQGLTQEQKEDIRNAIQNPGTGSVPSAALAIKLYLWMLAGVTHHIVYQPTLRIVNTAAPGWVWPSAFAGVGQIWTTGQLTAFTDQYGSLPFGLPSSVGVDADGYVHGWLKHYPSYNVTVGQRMIETFEFEYGKWPLDLYSAY